MTALLEAQGIQMRFSPHCDAAVTRVDLTVAEGASVGIVGESGSGKTTLARILVGALRPTHGTVRIEGREWRDIKRRDPLRRHVQMVFQDPYASLNPWRTPRETVAEVFRVWDDETARRASARAEDLLLEVGLPRDAIDRRPHRLSGGQCQRVGIARALACHPRVLIADEPTSSLDVSVQAQILNLLVSLLETRSLALVLISHDLGVVRYATEETLVMYAGRVVERGTTAAILNQPFHPYTRVLVDSIPGQPGGFRPTVNHIETTGGCVFANRCPAVQADCLQSEPQLRKVLERQVSCAHPFTFDSLANEESALL